MSDIFRDYSFGGWMNHFRIEKGLTLRQAAELMGLDAGNLSRLERSEFDPPKSREQIRKWLSALDKVESLNFLCSLAFQHHVSKLRTKFEEASDE